MRKKMMISYSLTGKMGDDIRKNNPCFNEIISTFLFYVHGGTVGEIDYSGLNRGFSPFFKDKRSFHERKIHRAGFPRGLRDRR